MVKTVTLPIRIQPASSQTLQDQIYVCIRRSIDAGLILADSRLPSTRALAADLGVSRTTVLLAFEQLKAEGYLVPRPGSGIYIAKELPDRRPDLRVVAAGPAVKHPLLSARGRSLRERGPWIAACHCHRVPFEWALRQSTCFLCDCGRRSHDRA